MCPEVADTAKKLWFHEESRIDHWFYGVFEGGGAKGVAFGGALQAMVTKRCWFKGVAGASAGAITAALVAAGLEPSEVPEATEAALGTLGTGAWAGLKRIRSTTGYFPADDLHEWLEQTLRRNVAPGRAGKAVTFQALYEATHIELNVVAADLSSRAQVVFSHLDTPKCSVADAVVASSSIPFGFKSHLLQVPHGDLEKGVYAHHTIVDGGVWSNFPMHVFEDSAFRESAHRIPVTIHRDEIIGFLLHEGEHRPQPRGEEVVFVDEGSKGEVRPVEWLEESHGRSGRAGVLEKLGSAALFPFAFFGRRLQENADVRRGRWPTPERSSARHLVEIVDGLLGGIHHWFFGAAAVFVVGVGSAAAINWVVSNQLEVLSSADWSHPLTYVFRIGIGYLAFLVVGLAALLPLIALFGVVANWVLLSASRRMLYGLMSTFVAGSGAAHWVALKPNVVALPIPEDVTTLSFHLTLAQRERVTSMAEDSTHSRLDEILQRRRRADPTDSRG